MIVLNPNTPLLQPPDPDAPTERATTRDERRAQVGFPPERIPAKVVGLPDWRADPRLIELTARGAALEGRLSEIAAGLATRAPVGDGGRGGRIAALLGDRDNRNGVRLDFDL